VTPEDAFANVQRVAVDTAPIIYLLEAHPQLGRAARTCFQHIDARGIAVLTSTLTLAETLVQPLRRGRADLVAAYRNALVHGGAMSLQDVDAETAEQAADVRARYNLRMPDAIQIATALRWQCQAFLTNDNDLRRVTELRVVLLSDIT
jgi:predicted nucleic acid-binding protein